MFDALKPHTQYIHVGDIFSRLLLLQATIQTSTSLVHILPTQSIEKKYQLLAQDRKMLYHTLSCYHDLTKLRNMDGRIFSLLIQDAELFLHPHILEKEKCFSVWENISLQNAIKILLDLWYDFHEYEKLSSFRSNGDLLKITSPYNENITLSFWGDDIEEILIENKKTEHIRLWSLERFDTEKKHKNALALTDYFKIHSIHIVLDMLEFHHLYQQLSSSEYTVSSFNILWNQESESQIIDLHISDLHAQNIEELRALLQDPQKNICVFTQYKTMFWEFLERNSFSHITVISTKSHLYKSFSYKNNVCLCDDIIAKIFIKKRVKKKLSEDIDLLLKIQNGDYVVHIDHGIWIFTWIIKKQLGNIEREYLEISYKENDKLFVPITEVQRVSKYVGSENPQLTPLSWKVWERKMKKIHEDIREIAENILENFAQRKLRAWKKNIFFKEKIKLFQESFPYSYTQDQNQSIEDIFADMLSEKNMDRLLVWDVWFWKTEIAFNAAYLTLTNKKQVILISPLVVLAHEHYEKAKERFSGLWLRIEVLTRLQSQRHATMVLKGLSDGSIDMVIGTHRLLSEKISYKNLGLMIVDEEHKFWVVDKEKIKNIRSNIDILSLSATPIPRSLNLALSGVRDISIIKTPPSGRKSIQTSVLRYNESLIQEAWKREFQRGWQIFFVHNRLSNIEVIKKQLEALFPKKKVIITHGQLPGEELENRIMDFKHKKYDILLSTTVIENGIDFSNVNTIFINECQSFGISQIHQLRWRVWRSDAQWYCYLLYRKDHIDGDAAKRLQTIVDYSYLWAGFELAMKDLEIRWGWDILWVRQSGQAQEIWVSLFLKMLEEKITELKEQKDTSPDSQDTKATVHIDTKIDLMISAGIPDSYFLSETDKLNFYREIEMISDHEDLEFMQQSFFGNETQESIPEETQNLFNLLRCQIFCKKYMIIQIKKVGINYQIDFHESMTIQQLKEFLTLDTEVKFVVSDIHRLRTPVKGFANDGIFIKYLLRLFSGWIKNSKIKLRKKAL